MTISDSFKSVFIEPILEEECSPPEINETTWGYDLTKVKYVYLLKAEENALHPQWTIDMGGEPLMLDADNEELTFARDYMVTDTRGVVFYCKPKFPLQFCYRVRSIFTHNQYITHINPGNTWTGNPWIGTSPTIITNTTFGTYNAGGIYNVNLPIADGPFPVDWSSQTNLSNINTTITSATA